MSLARLCLAALLLAGTIACTPRDSVPNPGLDGPRYLDPNVGRPARQTDFFGNDVLPRY